MSSLAPVAGREDGRRTVPDNIGTNELLASILNVLQRLDSRMDEQSKFIQALTDNLSSGTSKDAHITASGRRGSTGSEDQGELLRPGTPPQITPQPLSDNRELSSNGSNRIMIPPSISADNKRQRDQFKEAFQSSPFGPHFAKTEKFANVAKMVKSVINDPASPVQIFVEDTEGHVSQVDYTNDDDESYLGSNPLNKSAGSSMDARLGRNFVPELNLAAIHVPHVPYHDFPAPSVWLPGTRTFARNRAPIETLTQIELEKIGSTQLGTLWVAPPDGRVDFSFQSHHLKWLGHQKGTEQISQTSNSLRQLDDMEKNIRWDPCLLIEDYGLSAPSTPIQYLQTVRKVTKTRAEVSLIQQPGTSSRTGEYMAPWRRIVQFKGFAKLQGLIEKDQSSSIVTSEDETRSIGPSFSHIFVSLDRKYHDNVLRMLIQDTVEKHVSCSRNSRVRLQIPKFLSINYTNFHVTFFELIKRSSSMSSSSWTTGKLYSDDTNVGHARVSTESMCIRESACTILVIIDDKGQYWTALYMRPETFKRYIRSVHFESDDEFIVADLLTQAVACVVNQWAAIAKHLKTFIVDHHLLLDPEGHDRLLFDDDSFSRSRKYFWVINFLAECDSRIDENLQEIDLAMSDWSKKLEPEGRWHLYSQHMDEKSSKLREIQSNLRVKRAETIALRDGLFSASAVMESRASTRLGENVKLLTFVSIFFLPLSFCTSLWSINNQILPSSALAITITLVAIFTYLVVFNLSTLVNLSKRIYRKQRSGLIESMSTDTDSGWQEKGRRLKSFQPRQESENPSEWRIVVFLCRKLGRGFLWRHQGSGDGQRSGGNSEVKVEARGGNGESPGHEEGCEDGVDMTESGEQNTTDFVTEQVTGKTAVRYTKDSHTLFKIFTRNKLRQETRAEEV